MGEVYRARDARLNRDVAIKILPASFSTDPERLQRFAQESKATAALNHPNILSIFDIGEDRGAPYVVSELLEGETLRDRLRNGALTSRKAIDYAQQIARGLAAAHEKGIVHRDLKPENLFITQDGRAKILDFGLAKITRPEADVSGNEPTQQVGTEAGIVMGTVGYMSPEQVRGKPADPRSDIFAFGAILYEMLSGKRAFHGDSSVDTMSAILKEEPADLSETTRNVSPALERIVRHCLEKNPAERFQSARDVAFNLEALTDISSSSRGGVRAMPDAPSPRRWLMPALAAALLLASWAGIYRFARRGAVAPANPIFHEVTFRNGTIWAARFAPDGQTIVYGAAWEASLRKFSPPVSTAATPVPSACPTRRYSPSPPKVRWRSPCIPSASQPSVRVELWPVFPSPAAHRAKSSTKLFGRIGRQTASLWPLSAKAPSRACILNFPWAT
jgi:serine/threonine protein kinase